MRECFPQGAEALKRIANWTFENEGGLGGKARSGKRRILGLEKKNKTEG